MIIFQKIIKREDLKANPHAMYLFGDNVLRKGLGGQAKEMRGEPNARGIATKYKPDNKPESFFSDDFYNIQTEIIYTDYNPAFNFHKSGGLVVIPTDGIGSGLADLKNKSPKTWEYLVRLLEFR